MTEYLKKNWKIIAFAAVILLATYLRIWHFHDWLFFKMDQARDAFLTKQVYDFGPGWLPLLGPKAGGTKLNLGPVFYYFQYLPTVLFHSTSPQVMAYPDLFFSILSIPLFYLLLKKYFDRSWSMILASAYALCFLAIEYSRFAWNPNSLPFFNLLFFYALLNVFDEKRKYRARWVALAGASFAVSTQLHFLSFLTLPLVTFVFLIVERREILRYLDWKKITLFFVVILLCYAPVFANEIYTHGRDTKEFFAAIQEKASNHSLAKNIARDAVYFGENWLTILTGYIGKSKQETPASLTWIFFIVPALYLNIRFYRRENNPARRKFLLVTFCWFIVYFLAYIPIAYDIRPRFFLPMIVLPFIFAGYISTYLQSLSKKNKIFWSGAALAVIVAIIVTNLVGTFQWFREIKSAQKRGVYPKRTIILKARDGIVLWHLEKAAEYVAGDCQYPVAYYSTNAEYKYPVRYLLALKNISGISFKNFDPNRSGCFYAFGLTRSKKGLDSAVEKKFDVLNQEKFGALTVYKLNPKEEFLNNPNPKKEKPEEGRIFWKDLKI